MKVISIYPAPVLETNWWSILLLVILLAGILFVAKDQGMLQRMKDHIPPKVDERQSKIIGKAYKIGFLLMVAYQLLFLFLCTRDPAFHDNIILWLLLGLLITVLIVFYYCFWKDAVASESKSKERLLLYSILGFLSVPLFFYLDFREAKEITEMYEGRILSFNDFLLTHYHKYAAIGFFCLVLLANTILKMIMDHREQVREEEEECGL